MGLIRDAFDIAYPNGPASAPAQPSKEAIRNVGGVIEDEVTAAVAGSVRAESWAVLATITGTRAGQPAEVPEDVGSHTDPVVGGTVPNSGIFRWSASPAGWRRAGNYVDVAAQVAAIAVATALASEVAIAEVETLVQNEIASSRSTPKHAYRSTDGMAIESASGVLWIIPILGQSLGVRGTSGAAFSTTPVYPGRALMPSTGLRVGGGAESTAAKKVWPANFANLVEGAVTASDGITNESLASSFVNHLIRGMDAISGGDRPIVSTAIFAVGGADYRYIKLGSPAWDRMHKWMISCKRYADERGLRIEMPYALWVKGENEVFFYDRMNHTDLLRQVRRDLCFSARSLLGQVRDVDLFYNQTNRVVDGQSTIGQRVQISQVEAQEYDGLYCVGPIYDCEMGDEVHKSSLGTYQHGMKFSRAILSTMNDRPWRAMHVTDWYRASATLIRLNIHVPVEPMVIDVSEAIIKLTGMRSNKGFVLFRMNGTEVPVTNISIGSASTTTGDVPCIFLEHAAGITEPLRWSYAERRDSGDDGSPDGPVSGARGCIRDSAAEAPITGSFTSYNWLCQQSGIVQSF